MRNRREPGTALLSILCLAVLGGPGAAAPPAAPAAEPPAETVRARVQLRPGGPVEEVDMPLIRAPVEPATVPAGEADLADGELVLGVEAGGVAIAYPVRYLALYEVVNDRVGGIPISPTW